MDARWVIPWLVVGCGRVGFDAVAGATSDAARDTAGSGGSGAIDATQMMCASAAPVCGDGCCDGARGELCVTCPSDCATTSPVCGNGECDPGEDSTSCYADCGPTPWPWTSEEGTLLADLNQARTGGTTCPGGAMMTAPALVLDTSLQPGARSNAWQFAHEGFAMSNGTLCDGRTLADQFAQFGFSGEATAMDAADVPAALSFWLSNSALCQALMDPSYTAIGPAVAHDAHAGYVVRLK